MEAKGAVKFFATQGGNGRHTPRTVARFFRVKPLSAFGPTAQKARVVVDADFIKVYQTINGNLCDYGLERRSLFFAAFFVEECLFLKV